MTIYILNNQKIETDKLILLCIINDVYYTRFYTVSKKNRFFIESFQSRPTGDIEIDDKADFFEWTRKELDEHFDVHKMDFSNQVERARNILSDLPEIEY